MEFKAYLESIGDSIVCVADDEIVKIHVHTNDPGLAIQKALTYGQLSRMKIDNMREEHQEKLIRDAEKLAAQQAAEKKEIPMKDMGFIAVSIGEGMNEIFRELGADYIIEGGQTMNQVQRTCSQLSMRFMQNISLFFRIIRISFLPLIRQKS